MLSERLRAVDDGKGLKVLLVGLDGEGKEMLRRVLLVSLRLLLFTYRV
jgi:hypothetical protein